MTDTVAEIGKAFIVEISIDPMVLQVLIGLVIPLLVGLLTKINAPKWLKAVLNFGLAALAAFLTEMGGVFTLNDFIFGFVVTWVTSVSTYYGLLKPTGVSEAVNDKTSAFGIGAPRE